MARMTAAQRAVHPNHALALAYRAGWTASAKIDGPELETAEDRYARTHTELEQDAFAAGWIDYAADNAYGTGIRPVSVAPVTVDSTPAGIYSAMMRANASEQTAPQSRLYGLLSDYLRRTLTNTYGEAGEAVYGAIISSGEASDDVTSGAVADHAYRQTERAAERAMRNAEAAMRPANVTADYDCRHCLQRFTAAEFVWTGWFVNGENKGEFWTTCPAGHETVRHFPTNYSADTYNAIRNAAYDNALRPALTPQSALAARTAHRYVSRR